MNERFPRVVWHKTIYGATQVRLVQTAPSTLVMEMSSRLDSLGQRSWAEISQADNWGHLRDALLERINTPEVNE